MSRCAGRDGIGLRFAPFDDGVVHILRDPNRHQGGLVDPVQRAVQAVVLND